MGVAAELPPYIPADLRAASREVELAKRQMLFSQSNPVRSVFFVRSGSIEAVRYSMDGDSHVMMRAAPGEFFGEPALYVDDYTCSARALGDSCLAVFPKREFRQSLAAHPDFAMAFLQAQIANVRRQCSRYERIRLRKAEDRIIHYIVCEASADGCVTFSGSLTDWANELGLRAESLYRALAKLREDGRVIAEGSGLRLGARR